jgi:hypothetical protein
MGPGRARGGGGARGLRLVERAADGLRGAGLMRSLFLFTILLVAAGLAYAIAVGVLAR